MSVDLSNLKEDRDVVEPFVERLLVRLREKHPDVTLSDITISIEVSRPGSVFDPLGSASIRIRRMLDEMAKEGVVV